MTYGAKSSPIGWVGVVNQSPLRRNVLGLAVAGTFYFSLLQWVQISNLSIDKARKKHTTVFSAMCYYSKVLGQLKYNTYEHFPHLLHPLQVIFIPQF